MKWQGGLHLWYSLNINEGFENKEVYKKGGKNEVVNYRPVANLNAALKIYDEHRR